MLAIDTAMKLNLPPTVMLTEKGQPTDGWTIADKKLAVAYTLLQRETCGQCGNPLWICRSNNIYLSFSVRTQVCQAKARLEKWQEGKGKNAKKGELPYVVPVMMGDNKMPGRADYIKELNE